MLPHDACAREQATRRVCSSEIFEAGEPCGLDLWCGRGSTMTGPGIMIVDFNAANASWLVRMQMLGYIYIQRRALLGSCRPRLRMAKRLVNVASCRVCLVRLHVRHLLHRTAAPVVMSA